MRAAYVPLLSILSVAGFACGSKVDAGPVGTVASALGGAGTDVGPFINSEGFSENLSTTGSIDTTNAFFQSLGTNGRACVSCHAADQGFSITPLSLQLLFARCEVGRQPHSNPNDATACAVFRTNDGSNSPNADVSTTQARLSAYSMLLSRGVIRIQLAPPPNAEFTVVAVDDPYGYATPSGLSLFRRPLPATNLPFEVAVMWDGRETAFFGEPILPSLMSQANDATLSHAQATAPLTMDQQASIANFELGLFSAQVWDFTAGSLTAQGATGGPVALSQQFFTFGENTVPAPPGAPPFDENAFTIYDAWGQLAGQDWETQRRESVARGEVLFNTRLGTQITVPPGLPPTTCTSCHASFNDGALGIPVYINNVLVSSGQFRTPDMPLYTLKNTTTGEVQTSTDPGRALITGAWADVGAFKVPALRNLAARAPYFHDGSAATLGDVVDRYEQVLGFPFTASEKDDLVAFLESL